MKNLILVIYSILKTYIEIFKPYLCNHKWEYWHIKMRCGHYKHIDGNVHHNNIRKCSTCEKQQRLKMTPGNSRWIESYIKLSPDVKIIEQWVNVIGKKNKHQLREERIDKILNLKK